ncbi:MAG: hypothetical protein O6940_12765 [Ignavibacteria bacterium]|nr:hypothetical protein [Ignavibacteria bacterium]
MKNILLVSILIVFTLSIKAKAQTDTINSSIKFIIVDKNELMDEMGKNNSVRFHLIYTYAKWCKPCIEHLPKIINESKKIESLKLYLLDYEDEASILGPSGHLLKKLNYSGVVFKISPKYDRKERRRYNNFLKSLNENLKEDVFSKYLAKGHLGLSKYLLFDEKLKLIYVSSWETENKLDDLKKLTQTNK